MIPPATLDAAARVAAYAARRRIDLDPSLLPSRRPLGAMLPNVKIDAPGVDAVAPEAREPHPQGGGASLQRIISA
jgi:hypothetical protein